MWILAAAALAQQPTVEHSFADAEKWAAVFDDPSRDNWQKPGPLVAALQLAPGSRVADLGAGTGYFEPHLAQAVGPDGRVIAVDIEPTLVEHMTRRFADAGLAQVEARLGTTSDPKLGKREVDMILVVDTYHHIGERIAYFQRLLPAVKGRGRLVIVDFRADLPPPPGPPREHRLPADQVRAELTQAGWTFAGELDVLPQQYVLIFEK